MSLLINIGSWEGWRINDVDHTTSIDYMSYVAHGPQCFVWRNLHAKFWFQQKFTMFTTKGTRLDMSKF